MIATFTTVIMIALAAAIAAGTRPRIGRLVDPSHTADDGVTSSAAELLHSARGVVMRSALARSTSSLVRRSLTRSAPAPRAVADWCDDLARSLRSGRSLIGSLLDVVPLDRATRDATAPIRLGLHRARPVVEAVRAGSSYGVHLDLAVTVIATAAGVGGSAAPAIDRAAATLRQRAADLDERSVQASQARLSAHVMTAVPVLMLGTLVAVDDDVRSAVATFVGGACVIAGLIVNAAGWAWMRHIVRHP